MSQKNKELPIDYDLNGHAVKNARLVGCRLNDSTKTVEKIISEHDTTLAAHTSALAAKLRWCGRVSTNPTENNVLGDVVRNTTSNKTYVWDKNNAPYIVLSDSSSAERNEELDKVLTETEEGSDESTEVAYYGFGTEESAVYCKSATPAANSATYTITDDVATQAEETVSAYHALYEWIEI